MSGTPGGPSAFTKMRQVYWEAKQSFNKSLGQCEDKCVISSDHDLDIRLDLLEAADNYFNALMRVILDYRDALQDLVHTQENLGMALIEYGTKDSTAAGNVMCMSGRAISKAAQRQSQLKTYLMNLFHEVQTFQFKATADALQTVAKMEKVRWSYRSGLLWLKNESKDIDPDVNKKLKNFRKVQEHIKSLKVKFDGVKLESMQKIDLFLLSRSNLFSHTLVPYSKSFKKMSKHTILFMEYALKNIPLCLSYNFVALKELNQYSKIFQAAFQQQLSLEQMPKKQRKNTAPAEKPKSPFTLDESVNPLPYPISSEAVKINEILPLQTHEFSTETMLIDLNGEVTENQSLTKLLLEKNSSQTSPKYSEDLLLVNFDNYRPSFVNELSMKNYEHQFENSLTDSIDQSVQRKENDDLCFWSLIERHEQTSRLLTDNSERKTSPLIHSTESSTNLSDAKWNDILVQFDPFVDEVSKRQNKTDCLELC